MTSYPQFRKEFRIAQDLIIQSGKMALSYLSKPLKSSLKEDQTIVTEADRAIETFIRQSVSQQFPNYGFIGEETEEHHKEVSWIVDPIDGTVAFARNIPEFAIVISLKAKDETVFSCIYRPYLQELYTAFKNEGAFLDNKKITTSTVTSLENSLVSLDSGNIHKKVYPQRILAILPRYRVRIGHSAAVESSYVASGKVDALIKFKQSVWDVAPEYLLMKEAGAIITDEYGHPLIINYSKESKHNYIATTNKIEINERKSLYLT